MPFEVRVTIFILLALLAFGGIALLFLWRPLKRRYMQKRKQEYFYRKVMRVAQRGDYLLINDLRLLLDEKRYITIDHLLAGDKYIYVITDAAFFGAIGGGNTSAHWAIYHEDGTKFETPNPILVNEEAVARLLTRTGFDPSFVKGIVLINDECYIPRDLNQPGRSLVVPLKQFAKGIRYFESQNVPPFPSSALEQVMADLNDLNAKGHAVNAHS